MLLVIGAVACGSKKADRDAECAKARTVVVDGLKEQVDQLVKSGDKDTAAMFSGVLPTIEKQWDGFCHALDDHDIECIEKGAEMATDSACKSTVDKMTKQLLGM